LSAFPSSVSLHQSSDIVPTSHPALEAFTAAAP
jgi:hypothetical protein